MIHDWVFAGSRFVPDPQRPARQHYTANDGDVICVANFETAMLDLAVESSNASAKLEFEAFTSHIPPVATKVDVILEPIGGSKYTANGKVCPCKTTLTC